MRWEESLAVVLGGGLAGFVNTLASSGSAITLPLLVFLGIPPSVANGTNRLSVLAGSLTSMLTFHRSGTIPWSHALRIALPTTIGAAVGAGIASILSSNQIHLVVIFAVILAFILILTRSKQILRNPTGTIQPLNSRQILVFFLIGIWTGFIVLDSATYMLLALVMMVGYDLLVANAIKSVLLLITSVTAIGIFWFQAEIDWTAGMLLTVGSLFGGWLGAKFAMKPWAKIWVYRLLILLISLEIIQLIWKYTQA